MRKLAPVATALALCPALAQADDDPLTYSHTPTATCVANSETLTDARECIGRSANACQADTPGGYATVVISGCLSRELDWWDARLNAAYQNRRVEAREHDMHADPNAPPRAETLRDMQRAWIPYRDATCAWEAAQWSGGTGAGSAYLGCLMVMTGQQALTLEFSGGY